MIFTSDNAHRVSPEIMKALADANEGAVPSYGNDPWTIRLEERMSALFGRPVAVFPVMTGTAANALALATITPSYGAVLCHADAHVQTSECGAPEFYSGAKLLTIDGPDGKLGAEALRSTLEGLASGGLRQPVPFSVSITQSTEMGTLYRIDEIRAISAVARGHRLSVHMDGARFANAVAALDEQPAAVTCEAGVDVLSFGATKNGAMGAEAVIFFDRHHAAEFAVRRKRGGHLVSKQRYVSAQLLAYLENDLWLRNARHANAMATRLAEGLGNLAGVRIQCRVEANEVFILLPDWMKKNLLQAGAKFHDWPMPGDGPHGGTIRLVTSFATDLNEVDQFLKIAGGIG